MILRWPAATLGPAPSLKQTAVLCWCFLFALVVLPIGMALFWQDQADADFIVFYTLGRIFNEYPHDRLYDANLQTSLDDQVHPLKEGSYSAGAYPPTVALLFQPLARLPYRTAYRVWLLITLTLYVSGIVLLGRSLFPGQGVLRSLLLCVALAYFPFVIGTLTNGQFTAVAFFTLAMAVREDRKPRPLVCGLWLSVLAYKPTLLIWILPMLLVTRRWRALAGFTAGVVALCAVTTAAVGVSPWYGYLEALLGFRAGPLRFFRVEQQHPLITLSFWKYVDVTSFTTLLTLLVRWPNWVGLLVFGAASIVVAATFVNRWRRNQNQELIWATAISATLVVNLYTPIYDATLLVIGVMLTIAGVWSWAGDETRSELLASFLLIFGMSWGSLPLALATRVQFLTLLLVGLLVLQYRALGSHQEVLKPPGPMRAQRSTS